MKTQLIGRGLVFLLILLGGQVYAEIKQPPFDWSKCDRLTSKKDKLLPYDWKELTSTPSGKNWCVTLNRPRTTTMQG
jgi:hypothetical protein